jgi:hypothetical protein
MLSISGSANNRPKDVESGCAEGGRTIEVVARRSTSIQATPHSTAVHRLQCGQPYHSTVSCTTRLHCAYYRATALPASLLRRRLGSPASCQACPYQTTQSSCTPTRGFLVDDASGLPRTLAEEGVLISVVGSQIRHTPQRDKARRPLCSEVVHDHDQYSIHRVHGLCLLLQRYKTSPVPTETIANPSPCLLGTSTPPESLAIDVPRSSARLLPRSSPTT